MKSKGTAWIVTVNGHIPARFVSIHNALAFRVECIGLGMTAELTRAPR